MPARAETLPRRFMDSKNESAAVELLLIAGLALAWATITVVRLLLVPLLALAVVLLTPRRRPASPEAPAAPIAAPEAPALAVVSLASIGAELQALPAAELRAMAGTRRRCSKRELAAMVLAMPI